MAYDSDIEVELAALDRESNAIQTEIEHLRVKYADKHWSLWTPEIAARYDTLQARRRQINARVVHLYFEPERREKAARRRKSLARAAEIFAKVTRYTTPAPNPEEAKRRLWIDWFRRSGALSKLFNAAVNDTDKAISRKKVRHRYDN